MSLLHWTHVTSSFLRLFTQKKNSLSPLSLAFRCTKLFRCWWKNKKWKIFVKILRPLALSGDRSTHIGLNFQFTGFIIWLLLFFSLILILTYREKFSLFLGTRGVVYFLLCTFWRLAGLNLCTIWSVVANGWKFVSDQLDEESWSQVLNINFY